MLFRSAVAGKGMAASVGGRELRLGSTRLMQEIGAAGATPTALVTQAQELESAGRTVSWLADVTDQPTLMGLFTFGDAVKIDAREAVARLHALKVRTVLVTGDNRGSTSASTWAMPSALATAFALPRLSPVTSTVRTFSACNRATASRASIFTASPKVNRPISVG